MATDRNQDPGQDRLSLERKPTILFQKLCSLLQRMHAVRIQTKPRRLRLQEIVQLGDKRFVAILRVDGQEFLLGSSTNALSLLGTLDTQAEPKSFAASLAQADLAQTQPSPFRPHPDQVHP